MVHAAQMGEAPASGKIAEMAKRMDMGDAESMAATKHRGKPERKRMQAHRVSDRVSKKDF